MGINGLKDFLRKKSQSIFKKIPVSNFTGNRIAIDSDNILRKFMSTAHKEIVNSIDVSVDELPRDQIFVKLQKRLVDFTLNLINHGITPVYVFDGEHPEQKTKTKNKRREQKQKVLNDIQELREKIKNNGILSTTPFMVTELRKKLCQVSYITRDERTKCFDILSAMGIPCLQGIGDGERLCSMLCREGKVTAVFSTDSDLLAFGTSICLVDTPRSEYDPESKTYVESFEAVIFDGLLDNLSMSYETFIDLCIMAGCDYNDNIPGLGVGRAYNYLSKCKSIDKLSDTIPSKYHEHIPQLNIDYCRAHFSYELSKNLCPHDIILNINTDLTNIRDRLSIFQLENIIPRLIQLYPQFPHQQSIVSKPLQKIKLLVI